MALDLPEFERPANATSGRRPREIAPHSPPRAGSGLWETGSWEATLESTHASVQFAAFQGARKTMIESRFSLSLAAALVCMGLGFANSATAADARRGFGRRRRHQGCRVHGLPWRERQQQQSGVAEPRRPERRLHARAARDVQGAQAHQRNHVSDRRTHMSDQDFADVAAYFAAQTPTGLEADPSYWKAGEALYKSGDAGAQHSGVHRVPRPVRPGQRRRRLPGAARAAFGLHREAVAGLPHEESLP